MSDERSYAEQLVASATGEQSVTVCMDVYMWDYLWFGLLRQLFVAPSGLGYGYQTVSSLVLRLSADLADEI